MDNLVVLWTDNFVSSLTDCLGERGTARHYGMLLGVGVGVGVVATPRPMGGGGCFSLGRWGLGFATPRPRGGGGWFLFGKGGRDSDPSSAFCKKKRPSIHVLTSGLRGVRALRGLLVLTEITVDFDGH